MSNTSEPLQDMMVVLPHLEQKFDAKTTKITFRFQNQKVMLTYKHHLNKDEYKQWLANLTHSEPKFIEIAHENGTDDKVTPYEHSHVLIDFGRRFQTQNQRFFDFPRKNEEGNDEYIHPHIQPITTVTRWHNTVRYIAKEDPECFHLLKDKMSAEEIINKIQDCKTTGEVIKNFMTQTENGKINWQDLESINRLRNLLPKEDDEFHSMNPEDLNYPWQIKLMQELSIPCALTSRKIIWYVDLTGNTGKSELAFSLNDRNPNQFALMQGLGRKADNAMNIKSFVDKGWTGHCLFINLPRKAEHFDGFYETLEEAKDARLTCQKYEGGNVKWRRGHVVVFANWYPKKSCLSEDRWDIRWINPKKDSYLDDDDLPPPLD